jgi:hypothetical protein
MVDVEGIVLIANSKIFSSHKESDWSVKAFILHPKYFQSAAKLFYDNISFLSSLSAVMM